MAKGGVTYTEVFDAYQALTAAGEKPTDRAILEHIGAGSMTTIIKHRKLVVARMNGVFGEGSFVSESLKNALAGVEAELQKIYEGKVAQAEANGSAAVQEVEGKLAAANQALERSMSENTQLNKETEVVRSLLDHEIKRTDELRAGLQSTQEHNAALTATVEQLRERVKKAEQAEAHAISQQKHYEERTKEQMNAARQVHEKAVEQLQNERSRSEGIVTNLSERLATSTEALAIARTELTSATRSHEETRRELIAARKKIELLEESVRKAAEQNLQTMQDAREKAEVMSALRESNLENQHRYDILAKEHHQVLMRLQELEKRLAEKSPKTKGKASP